VASAKSSDNQVTFSSDTKNDKNEKNDNAGDAFGGKNSMKKKEKE
jgi:hypothetical protein